MRVYNKMKSIRIETKIVNYNDQDIILLTSSSSSSDSENDFIRNKKIEINTKKKNKKIKTLKKSNNNNNNNYNKEHSVIVLSDDDTTTITTKSKNHVNDDDDDDIIYIGEANTAQPTATITDVSTSTTTSACNINNLPSNNSNTNIIMFKKEKTENAKNIKRSNTRINSTDSSESTTASSSSSSYSSSIKSSSLSPNSQIKNSINDNFSSLIDKSIKFDENKLKNLNINVFNSTTTQDLFDLPSIKSITNEENNNSNNSDSINTSNNSDSTENLDDKLKKCIKKCERINLIKNLNITCIEDNHYDIPSIKGVKKQYLTPLKTKPQQQQRASSASSTPTTPTSPYTPGSRVLNIKDHLFAIYCKLNTNICVNNASDGANSKLNSYYLSLIETYSDYNELFYKAESLSLLNNSFYLIKSDLSLEKLHTIFINLYRQPLSHQHTSIDQYISLLMSYLNFVEFIDLNFFDDILIKNQFNISSYLSIITELINKYCSSLINSHLNHVKIYYYQFLIVYEIFFKCITHLYELKFNNNALLTQNKAIFKLNWLTFHGKYTIDDQFWQNLIEEFHKIVDFIQKK